MKLSQYNLYIENRENLIIYNTISNGVLEVEKQYALEIKSYNQGGMQLSRELKDNLIKGSMLVPDNLDEYRMLKVLHLSNVYDNQRVDFTIAPTLKCNFRCSYCYEEGHRYHTMSRIVVDQTIKFIKELSKNKRDLSITWYGGEPLLQLQTIKKITKEIKNKDLNYSSAIVTNGYFLTRGVAEDLKLLDIKSVQITIDGPPEIHNKRRKVINGEDSFDVILRNIRNIYDLLDITIRINVDSSKYKKY